MIEKIQISDASIAEEIRKNMAVVTSSANGLMSKGYLSGIGSLSTGMSLCSGDLNELHSVLPDGLTTLACAIASVNRPYPTDLGGVLIHINRIEGFSVKMIIQEYYSVTKGNSKKSRIAIWNGTEYEFSVWG